MVSNRRKVIWTLQAISTKKAIFKYWNKRNKSLTYSKKLNELFISEANQIPENPESSISSNIPSIRLRLVSYYYLVYKVSADEIYILDIWDTRQNPNKFNY